MLVGDKVILDVIESSSIEWLRKQRNLPEMRRYFRAWKDISKDMQLEWYKEIGNNTHPNHVYWEIRERGNMDVIDDPPTGNLIGCCGLHYVDYRLRSAEFSIFLCKDVRGIGYGKEALDLMFDFGFREINLHKIWAEVYDFNKALNVYTKGLGMHIDGRLRHNTFCDGKYHDSIMLSVLEDEWFDAHGER